MRRLGPQLTAPISRPDQPPTPGVETAPAPNLIPAYFHKSPIALYDLTAPIPVAGSHSQWSVFSQYDCKVLEARYQETRKVKCDKHQEKADCAREATNSDGERQRGKPPSPEEEEEEEGLLLVGIERLHSVDLDDWKMKPVYWTSRNASATFTSVRRGTWFYASDSLPVEDEMAEALERGYHEVKPWTMAYEAELEAAGELGVSAEAKLKYNIGEDSSGQYIIFRNERVAWIGSRSLGSKLVRSIYNTIGRSRKEAFIEVFRGYDFSRPHPIAKVSRDHSPAPSGSKRRSTSLPRAPEKLKDIQGDYAGDEDEDGIPKPAEVTDLILVIHGIGQKLAETSEGWTFTHAVTRLRLLLHEQMIHKDVLPCLRENFCPQVLPINWRVNFDPDAPDTHRSDQADGNPAFSLDDITIDAIPAVRDLIGKVVFDIPYYMSHHKPRMIEAVVTEANRIYALWMRNNKTFEARGGRVHIICHSLGSAISFDVLSNQPNDVKARSSLYDVLAGSFDSRASRIREGPNHFSFNTTNLICAGSPAAFFLLLKQQNLVPRKRIKPDKAPSRDSSITSAQGSYGCLAAKAIYNVFYATDPIAYRMNPTIDSGFAQSLPPTQVPSTTAPFFSSLKLPFGGTGTSQAANSERPELRYLPSQVELETHDFERETIADQRLHLLNENGSLDYVLPMSGYIDNQYLSMVYAHQGYWDSKEFARLIIIECGRQEGKVIYKGHKSPSRLENTVSSGG
ncbi:protein of unknown function [Taphrina deformans PYCC 5710]|uniref:DDHD domain-containing protein n=1 Tax=Taphrina deformans (strain PYCC 5710 / ATCC 11124 / CBS 356.35 / IMI 108563 / JCM 9778 / NBRC 8474) TaxID=1097556 RepID=R4XEJ2_TAPDE|nr:protein of unknown function [Taphrina deformans PYCC 5710]|eukprot:CCG84077.1 protein of unknown function [Taphrina deformans PYCC 5710]